MKAQFGVETAIVYGIGIVVILVTIGSLGYYLSDQSFAKTYPCESPQELPCGDAVSYYSREEDPPVGAVVMEFYNGHAFSLRLQPIFYGKELTVIQGECFIPDEFLPFPAMVFANNTAFFADSTAPTYEIPPGEKIHLYTYCLQTPQKNEPVRLQLDLKYTLGDTSTIKVATIKSKTTVPAKVFQFRGVNELPVET